MTNHGLNYFNKFYLFKLKALALSCIFIFCFEVVAAYEEVSGDLTRTPSIKSPADHSVRSSVWRLSTRESYGTGFFIASNKLVTNFHVISALLRDVSNNVEDITLSQEGDARTLKIKGVLAVSAVHDLALLETTGSVDHYLHIRQEPLQEQEDLSIIAYDVGELIDVRNTSDIIMFPEDMISFFVNKFLFGGSSGGPVVDMKRQVVGVHHSGSVNSAYSVNLNNLQVFVQEGLRSVSRDNFEQVIKREVENLKNLAEQGDALAQFNLGRMYVENYGVAQNDELAFYWIEKAAEQGDSRAQNNLGGMYEQGDVINQNDEEAVHWYSKAAEQGDALAQYNLGGMYEQGRGVNQDYETAIYWYSKASEQGHAEAKLDLGMMYYGGTGVPQSYEMVVHWFKKASEQGHAIARYNLGKMYAYGEGVDQNSELAIHWFTQALNAGFAEAGNTLGMMYYGGTGGVPQSYESAIHWLEKAAEQGYPPAQYNLGFMYVLSLSDEDAHNYEKAKAIHWLEKAVEQNYPQAQDLLDAILSDSIEVTTSKAALGDTTHTSSVESSAEYSVRSAVWMLSIRRANGTGFFIAPNKFITNFHVISALLRSGLNNVEDITLSQEGNPRTLKIKGVLAMSALHDLVLFETTQSVDHYLSIRQEPFQEQEDLFMTGYPGGNLTDIRNTSDIIFSKYVTSFFINHSALNGFSGSPIVDAGKRVVGVLSSGVFNLAYSVHLNNLQAFIQTGLKSVPEDNLGQVIEREVEKLRNLAEQGDNIEAQFILGLYYESLVPQKFELAAHWYSKAAEQGYSDAQNNLGKMYEQGHGVDQDDEMAVYWFERAAEQGNVESRTRLGMMYRQGRGVNQDDEMAVYWFERAAEQGYVEAQNHLGILYTIGAGTLQQNYEMAVHWFRKAAEQGLAAAQTNLGGMYYEGEGVSRDDEMAVHWFRKAAEQGYPPAQAMLDDVMTKE